MGDEATEVGRDHVLSKLLFYCNDKQVRGFNGGWVVQKVFKRSLWMLNVE